MVRSWRLGWSGCSSLKLYEVNAGPWTMTMGSAASGSVAARVH